MPEASVSPSGGAVGRVGGDAVYTLPSVRTPGRLGSPTSVPELPESPSPLGRGNRNHSDWKMGFRQPERATCSPEAPASLRGLWNPLSGWDSGNIGLLSADSALPAKSEL